MHMTTELIIQKAVEEIEAKTWGVTESFLEVHKVAYEDGKPKVLRVDMEKGEGVAIVYFAIDNQDFYFAVRIATIPEISLDGVWVEDYHSVAFLAWSDDLSFDEICAYTTLKPYGGWTKGQKRSWANSFHKDTVVRFEPNPEPDEFEDKLDKLLSYLEKDMEGILKIVEDIDGGIQIASIFHNGNTCLGGHQISKSAIKRIAALNLEINTDLYAKGNFFK